MSKAPAWRSMGRDVLRRARPLLSVLGLLGSLAGPAWTQVAEPIIVAEIVVLRIRTPAGGISIAERAKTIRRRITLALTSEDLTPSNVYIQPAGSDLSIRVGRVLLVTITEPDARANETTMSALAARWLAAFREALPRAKPLPRPSP